MPLEKPEELTGEQLAEQKEIRDASIAKVLNPASTIETTISIDGMHRKKLRAFWRSTHEKDEPTEEELLTLATDIFGDAIERHWIGVIHQAGERAKVLAAADPDSV